MIIFMKKYVFPIILCFFSQLLPVNDQKITQKIDQLFRSGMTVKRYFQEKWQKKERIAIQNIAKEYSLSQADLADIYQKIEQVKRNQINRKGNNPTFSFASNVPESLKKKIVEIGKSKNLPITEVQLLAKYNPVLGCVGYPVAILTATSLSYNFKDTNFVLGINASRLNDKSIYTEDYVLTHEIKGHLKNWDTLKLRILEAKILQKNPYKMPDLMDGFSNPFKNLLKVQEARADLNYCLTSISNAQLIENIANKWPLPERDNIYLQPKEWAQKARKIGSMLEAQQARRLQSAVGCEILYEEALRRATKNE